MKKKKIMIILIIFTAMGIFLLGCKSKSRRHSGGIDVIAPAVSVVEIENLTMAAKDPESIVYTSRFELVKDGDHVEVRTAVEVNTDNALTGEVTREMLAADLSELVNGGKNGVAETIGVMPTTFDPVTGEAVWNIPAVDTGGFDGEIAAKIEARDIAGNLTVVEGHTTADNTPPSIENIDPPDGSDMVHSGTNIRIQFSEGIRQETSRVAGDQFLYEVEGNEITDAVDTQVFWAETNDQDDTMILVTDIVGKGVIDNNDLLTEGKTYGTAFEEVEIRDLAGNPVSIDIEDINDDGIYSFTIGDSSSPFIESIVVKLNGEEYDPETEILPTDYDQCAGFPWQTCPVCPGPFVFEINFTDDNGKEVMDTSRGEVQGAVMFDSVAEEEPDTWLGSLEWMDENTLRFEQTKVRNTNFLLPSFDQCIIEPGKGNILTLYGIQDASGNMPLEAILKFRFFTQQTRKDDIPPRVLSTFPADGATGVDVDTAIAVAFSEDLRPDSWNNLAISLRVNSGSGISVMKGETVDISADFANINPATNHSLLFFPQKALPPNANIEVNIGPFSDLGDGDDPYNTPNTTTGYSFSFQTSSAKNGSLVIDAALPAVGDTDVSPEYFSYSGMVGFVDSETGRQEFVRPGTRVSKDAILLQEVESGAPVKGLFLRGDSPSNAVRLYPGGSFAGPLRAGMEYEVGLTSGSVTDLSGSPVNMMDIEGTPWRFTTADGNSAPIILPSSLYMRCAGFGLIDLNTERPVEDEGYAGYFVVQAIDLDEGDTLAGSIVGNIETARGREVQFSRNLHYRRDNLPEWHFPEWFSYASNIIAMHADNTLADLMELLASLFGEELVPGEPEVYDQRSFDQAMFPQEQTFTATLVDSEAHEVSVSRKLLLFDKSDETKVLRQLAPIRESDDDPVPAFSMETDQFVTFEWDGVDEENMNVIILDLYERTTDTRIFFVHHPPLYHVALNPASAGVCPPTEKNRFCHDAASDSYKLLIPTSQLTGEHGNHWWMLGQGVYGYGYIPVAGQGTYDFTHSQNHFLIEE